MKRKVSMVIVVAMVLSLLLSTNAYAEGTETAEEVYATGKEYAYSIGHNFGIDIPFVEDLSGDCTISVTHASTVYGMLGYESYYNYDPTYEYLRGKNPGGVDRLGSAVVYIDGHANYDNIVCGDYVDDSDHKCGVYYLNDFTSSSSGYTYAGLASRNLRGVKLFSFVGCNTASQSTNLCTKALAGGAKCVVGFTGSINGLGSEGQNWKKAYNNSLGNGSTVSAAIAYATKNHPNCNLGDYAKIHGDGNVKIALNSTRENSGVAQVDMQEGPNVQTVKTTGLFFNFNLVENGKYIALKEVENEYSDIIKIMKESYPQFNVSEYKVLANGYAGNSGIIKMRCFINDIETSSVVVFTVVDGEIVDYSDSYADSLRESINENEVVRAKIEFARYEAKAMSDEARNDVETEYDVESQTGRYYYDFSDNTLYYVTSVVYSLPGTDACNMTEVKTPIRAF